MLTQFDREKAIMNGINGIGCLPTPVFPRGWTWIHPYNPALTKPPGTLYISKNKPDKEDTIYYKHETRLFANWQIV
jgi:hypothetical protein